MLNIDCMEYMATLPDNSFDLAIVDPPYGIKMDGKAMSDRASNSPKYRNYVGRKYHGVGWDNSPMPIEYFIELKRVSKNQIIWGANHFIENIPESNSSSWVAWYKNGQCPGSTNADCELAWTSHKTAVKYFRFDWSGFGHVNARETRIHPTQKPVKLYEWLLTNYAEKGQRILDTHLGSGSSAIAAHYFGVDFVGMEIDKDYHDAACKRFDNETKQQDIFSEQVSNFGGNEKGLFPEGTSGNVQMSGCNDKE